MLTSIAVSLFTVFVAEIGDKTQIIALGFGARHRLRVVVIGLGLGYAISNLAATLIGAALGDALPTRTIGIISGLIFCGLAIWTIRDAAHQHNDTTTTIRGPAVIAVAVAIAIGELGDKTQIATAALATSGTVAGTWIGATVGATAAGALGAVAGHRLAGSITPTALRRGAAAAFALAGVVTLVTSLR
jgi:putative Ca2+/H+ antiporter (TMEM165/GDT1 family)